MRRLLLMLSLVLALAAPAQADPVEVTAQAKATRAEFLLRVAPPATPAAICLVDTGVNANPDTVGVIAKVSLPQLDGSDQSPTQHGTQMAMIIGGRSNGFGMVGLWPQARIVSVQANLPGTDQFPIGAYIAGIQRCYVEAQLHGTKVIVVAISSEAQPSAGDAVLLADAVAAARSQGLNVVVAGGNFNGRPVGTPANVPGAFSVGSVDAQTGDLCPTSSTGALVLAPGCSIDAADPTSGQPLAGVHGTSSSAAIVASAVAALRTWRPDLTPDGAEQLINETGVTTAFGRRLDLTAAFTAAGLQAVVAPPPPPPPPAVTPVPKQRLAKPRLTVRQSGRGSRRTLRIRASNRPPRTVMTVRVYRGGKGKLRRIATRSARSAKATLRVSRRWTRVTAYFTDPTGQLLQSPSTKVAPRR